MKFQGGWGQIDAAMQSGGTRAWSVPPGHAVFALPRPAPHQGGQAAFDLLLAEGLAYDPGIGVARIDAILAICGHEHERNSARPKPVDDRIDGLVMPQVNVEEGDRKSTRLNSSHMS